MNPQPGALGQKSSVSSCQPEVLSQESAARNPQPGFLSQKSQGAGKILFVVSESR